MSSSKPPESVKAADDELPFEDDIMKLARYGEIGLIQKLFDSGKYDASYKDEQGLTPLHVCISKTVKGAFLTKLNLPVGCNQETLCFMSFPHPSRRRCKCERRRY